MSRRARDTRLVTVLAAVLAIGLGVTGAIPRWWWTADVDTPVGKSEARFGLRGVHVCVVVAGDGASDVCTDSAYQAGARGGTGDASALFVWETRAAWWGALGLAVASLLLAALALARRGSQLLEFATSLGALVVIAASAHLVQAGPGLASAALGPGGPLTIAGAVAAAVTARFAGRDVMA